MIFSVIHTFSANFMFISLKSTHSLTISKPLTRPHFTHTYIPSYFSVLYFHNMLHPSLNFYNLTKRASKYFYMRFFCCKIYINKKDFVKMKWSARHERGTKKKTLSPQQDSNLRPLKHRAGVLSTWTTENSWGARPSTRFIFVRKPHQIENQQDEQH